MKRANVAMALILILCFASFGWAGTIWDENFENEFWTDNWINLDTSSGDVSINENNDLNNTRSLVLSDFVSAEAPVYLKRNIEIAGGTEKIIVRMSLNVRSYGTRGSGPIIGLLDSNSTVTNLGAPFCYFLTGRAGFTEKHLGWRDLVNLDTEKDTGLVLEINTWYDLILEADINTGVLHLWGKPSAQDDFFYYAIR